jgi:pilus assembly protein Flp/PilA
MTRFQALCSTAYDALGRFAADERGATAIEYAMVASGVGAAIAATVMSLGSSVKGSLYEPLAALLL